jgi:hypothetical protein
MLIKIPAFLILKANTKLSNTLEILESLLPLLVPFFSWRTCLVQDCNRVNSLYLYLSPAAKILSNELGHRIRYVKIPLEQVRQANEDIVRMYEWYERVGTGIDITSLHQEYPEVNWLTFKDWAKSQNTDEIM